MNIRKLSTRLFIILSLFVNLFAAEFDLKSPDGRIDLNVSADQKVTWSVSLNGQRLILPSGLSMIIDGENIPREYAVITDSASGSIDDNIETVVAQKSKYVRDHYNELKLDFEDGYSLIFRVYNNGCAYRFVTNFNKAIKIFNEDASINFAGDYKIYFPEEGSMVSHYEQNYKHINISTIEPGRFCSLPALVETVNGVKIGITESGLYDYPGMFLSGTGSNGLKALFPKYVLEAEDVNDRDEKITEEADYIAYTNGDRKFPWRVFMISENDGELVENQMVFLLSDPLKLKNTGWIKPGKVAWDWWNALNIYGVDFKSGLNTDTYKYYIDFASEYGLDYIILDEGWSKSSTEISEPNPDIDIKELINYGNNKSVGIILWTLWKPLDKNIDDILKKYNEWGIKGIKVDFMQRTDQAMVQYYEKVCKKTAEYKLLVDFHGAFKPSGLIRPYPNYLTSEGVKGMEHNKWSKDITPEHDLTLPFTRMIAGPMDFTPGAMLNMRPENFRVIFDRPMSQGTRLLQAAMYVVYESPLQMLCDSPSRYKADPVYTKYISRMPTTWDETKVLSAKVRDHIIVARKKENVWYVGGMNNGTAKDISIDLSFLTEGTYKAEILEDGINAYRYAIDHKFINKDVTKTDSLRIHFAPDGGWTAIITPE